MFSLICYSSSSEEEEGPEFPRSLLVRDVILELIDLVRPTFIGVTTLKVTKKILRHKCQPVPSDCLQKVMCRSKREDKVKKCSEDQLRVICLRLCPVLTQLI